MTVSNNLKKLEKLGLAEKIKGGWIRGARSLEDVAVEQGSSYKAYNRRETHYIERKYHHQIRRQLFGRKYEIENSGDAVTPPVDENWVVHTLEDQPVQTWTDWNSQLIDEIFMAEK